MTIAEVCKKCGLSQDTLRYYERIGLLPSVRRNKSGNREYTDEDLKWVTFIKCMRGAGVSVEVLIEYVLLFQQGDKTVQARKALLMEQRKVLADRIEEMQTTFQRLDAKIARYEQRVIPKENALKKLKEPVMYDDL